MDDYKYLTEEDWAKATPPLKRGRTRKYKTRPIVWEYVSDVINDEGRRHCYLTDRHMNGSTLRKLSENTTGDWWGRKDHFTHSSGGYSEVYVHKSKWPEYLAVREAVQNLTSIEDVGWHPSQCAKTVDLWLGFREAPVNTEVMRSVLPRYSFCTVMPCELPQIYEHDMSGAYWQIVKATPTPLVYLFKDMPGFIGHKKMTPDQSAKWNKMVDVISPHKGARLAIVGNWVGRYGFARWRNAAQWHYRHGKIVPRIYRRGGLSSFGLLIVRMVYELCQEEYLQDNAVYAWVDCVMTTSDVAHYWKTLGIPYTIKAAGYLNLYAHDCYQLGSKKVGYYDMIHSCETQGYYQAPDGHRFTLRKGETIRRPLLPTLIPRTDYYHRKLLQRWGILPTSLEELPPIKHDIELPPYNLRLNLPVPSLNPPPPQQDIHL